MPNAQPDRTHDGLPVMLNHLARFHARESTPVAEAVADLQAVAGSDRDACSIAAGTLLGGYLASPNLGNARVVQAASLLILAGADPRLVAEYTDVTRRALTQSDDA